MSGCLQALTQIRPGGLPAVRQKSVVESVRSANEPVANPMNFGQVHLAVHQRAEFFADGRFDDQTGHDVLILEHGPERLDR